MGEKPTAAFVLSLIGGIFYILLGIAQIAVGSAISVLPIASSIVLAIGGLGLVCGILMILGSVWINSGASPKIKNGSILVLVFSIVGIASSALIFFILGLVGSILGLTWKPPMATMAAAPAPPTPP